MTPLLVLLPSAAPTTLAIAVAVVVGQWITILPAPPRTVVEVPS